MTGPFRLVTKTISHDTVGALQTLLDEAEKGDLIGIAFAVMYSKGGYITDAAGEAYESPTFARGMVKALDDRLREILRELSSTKVQ
ncbi:hypothetical protein [Nitrosovibrio sp. Nv4]|uniref:hypothetical protein n=1 Tax=Nitrosovibrio sp. Nv4 TaxID=1945880 RepID=UPI000BD47813|nr:hypothetical protein [Nitrosovibrio sp. Nv4]SOD42407.1 hypothetical protein SAMN06298226_2746 [Nitrosovibrio sp. Nv4]